MSKKNTPETAGAGESETSEAFRQQLTELAAKRIADHRELLEIKDTLLKQALRLSELGFADVSSRVLDAASRASKIKPAKG